MNSFDLASFAKSIHKTRQLEIEKEIAGQPLASDGLPFVIREYNASSQYAALVSGVKEEIGGVEIHYLKEGSNPTFRIDIEAIGKFERLAPGQAFRAKFDNFTVRLSATAQNEGATGLIRLLIIKTNVGAFKEASEPPPLIVAGSSTQTYNVTTNTPSAATDGVSLEGAVGSRCIVASANGTTIAGGTVVPWYYDPITSAWYQSTFSYTLATGNRRCVLPDEVVTVPFGRVYYELRSATNSGGSGSFDVYARVSRQ